MQARKSVLEKTYKAAEKEAKELQQKMENVSQYIGQDISAARSLQQQTQSQDRDPLHTHNTQHRI